MNPIKSAVFLIFFSLFTFTSFAQTTSDDEDKLSLNSGTIDNQFEYVLRKSGNFRGTNGQMYEAVKLSMLLTLRAHAIDSLKTLRKDLADTQAIVDAQAKEITDLKSNLGATKETLDKTNAEKNSMSFFGAQMSKTGYNVLMWTIIAGLLALLLFFIYKFKNSNAITRNAKKALEEIEEEFDEHRKTALEREQKVRRQLQDEINKQKKA
ncbi:tRNA (guanine-N1)-methyltransferase [Sabulilitoribacter multivorans]|uniref:tRNA (Guanine-N1)-methyltransferase n=1 Tax=Flaviramulus multivorans TaxID=1304750 RepID=A0ABS9IM85_9FLAO|nr:tRNA (guanine-N1)-methyltransferase [Flaviramulus multivorans]MCF7561714.1 tRNA (guanine-N1)-methyltransferase [Flaviramulus multivorans]